MLVRLLTILTTHMENARFLGALGNPSSVVAAAPAAPPQLKYCLYARKSTEQEEKQILSIDSQIKEMVQIAQREGLNVVEVKRESHSAKASGQREVFNELIADVRSGKFNCILTWAPDRLSRNAGDLGAIIDLMDQKLLLQIRTYSQTFTDSPNEKFLLMILGSQAKLENDNRSINIKRGMRTRVEMGLWPGMAPTGYINEKRTDKPCSVIPDPMRAPIVKQIFEKVADNGWSGRKIFNWLKHDLRFVTKSGKILSLSNIYLILRNLFYYGSYEYPKKSGKWYTGKHTPIISQELFAKVQEKLNQEISTSAKTYGKEFAFTKLVTCGLCGSGVCADEKFKKLKDGSINRYFYYGCNKSKNYKCNSGYVREELLIDQLSQIIDKIDLDELGIKTKITEELERYSKFQSMVLDLTPESKKKQKEINARNYAKYVLKEGGIQDKRELLACLKSKLILTNKILTLE